MSDSAHFDFLLVNPKELKASKYFWIGFVLYTTGFTLVSINVSYLICQPMQIIGMLLFISSSFTLIQFRFDDKFLRFFFTIYILWLFSVMMRGFVFTLYSIEYMLYEDYLGIFPYFAPLILLFPKTIFTYQRVFKVIILLGIFCLLLEALYFRQLITRDMSNVQSRGIMESIAKHLSLPSTFLLLTYSYHTKKIKIFALAVSIITMLFAIIRARRGLIFITATPMIFAYMISLLMSKKKISIVLVSLFSLLLLGIWGMQFFSQSSMFSSLKSRADEDTRSGVEDCFQSDMQTKDWIIGKGINGAYYCPGVDKGSTTGYRSVIETDYENIILKGGLISLGLLILITSVAAIKGIFFSKNILSKAAGFWILGWILSLYPATGVVFTLNYLLVWLCVGICYSKNIRYLPEEVVKIYFSTTRSLKGM